MASIQDVDRTPLTKRFTLCRRGSTTLVPLFLALNRILKLLRWAMVNRRGVALIVSVRLRLRGGFFDAVCVFRGRGLGACGAGGGAAS